MSDIERCDGCGDAAGRGDRYCPLCGRPTGVREESSLRPAGRIVGIIMLLVCTVFLFFQMYAVFWAFGDIFGGIGSYYIAIQILTPSPTPLFWVSGAGARLYYLLIVAGAAASFVALMYTSRDGIREVMRGKIDNMDNMPLYAVATMFAAVISFTIIFNIIMMMAGNDPASPIFKGPYWGLWFSYLNAAVWEEVLCRILMVGVPMVLLGLAANEKGSWKRLFGGFGLSRAAVLFIVLSSAIFSYAHLQEWDVFKLIPTFVAGLALGFLFVRFGIHAAIMLHFLINYNSAFIWILGDGAETPLAMIILMIVLFGIVFIVRYTIHGIRYLSNIRSEPQKPL